MEYERALTAHLNGRRIVALCSYSLADCNDQQINEIIHVHHCAFDRLDKEADWQVVTPRRPSALLERSTEDRFDTAEWARLTPAQRAERCMLMAEEAQALADAAPLEMKESYLNLATQWLILAQEIGYPIPDTTLMDVPSIGARDSSPIS